MEAVVERGNMIEALRRVKANKGSAGVDGMTVEALTPHLKAGIMEEGGDIATEGRATARRTAIGAAI